MSKQINKNPIDFVIAWVDGNDLEWRKKRDFYSTNDKDKEPIRFRDWGTLKYIFRGIEKYAPFVNKVFLITDNQVPEWININHPKLRIIDHKDFIPEEFLPTFNSNAIEINIHRIDELSENFVLFNDDTYIINQLNESDLFVDDLPCDSAIMNPLVTYDKDKFSNVLLNDLIIINKYFDKEKTINKNFSKWFSLKYKQLLFRNVLLSPWKHFLGFYDFHIPCSYNKSTFRTLWEKEEQLMIDTSKSKFRDNQNNINHWLFRYWQLASNSFIPRSVNFGKLYHCPLSNDDLRQITNTKNKTICLNDDNYKGEDVFEPCTIIELLETKLPDKSLYEKE